MVVAKAPERACMPLRDWPEVDQRLWHAACAPADVLSEEFGARSNMLTISNRKAEKGYGRWMTYLTARSILVLGSIRQRSELHLNGLRRTLNISHP